MPRAKKPVVEEVRERAGGQPAVSKSQAVRNYLEEHRHALPTAVSETLKAQGVDVDPKYVSNIKFQMGIKKRRKKAAPAAVAETPVPKDAISLSALLEAKKLVAKLGSTEAAKKAILALAQLGD